MKRSDQHNIDPAEAGATDYKNLPQTGRDNSNLDDTVELDRQKHAQSAEEASQSPAPGTKPAPSRDANRSLDAKGSDDVSSEPGAADASADKENPLV
ncbi:MAG: hypothetical protein WD766_14640 [Gemmatimonadota bacterium]